MPTSHAPFGPLSVFSHCPLPKFSPTATPARSNRSGPTHGEPGTLRATSCRGSYDAPGPERRCAGDNPLRVIIDPELDLMGRYKIFREHAAATLVVAAKEHGDRRGETHGCEILGVPRVGRTLDVSAIRAALGDRGLSVVFIEGGGITISRFLEAGCLNRLQIRCPDHYRIGPSRCRISRRPCARLPLRPRIAVSTWAATRCLIVISMREALASLAVFDESERDQNQPLQSLALGAAKACSILPDLMPHLAAADVRRHTLRHH